MLKYSVEFESLLKIQRNDIKENRNWREKQDSKIYFRK